MKRIKSRLIVYLLLITTIPVVAFLLYSLVFVADDVTATRIEANETKLDWASQYLDLVNDQIDDVVYTLHIREDLLADVDASFASGSAIEDVIKDVLYNNANLLSEVEVVSMNSRRSATFDYERGFTSVTLAPDAPIVTLASTPAGLRYVSDEGRVRVLHTINDFDTQALLGVIVLTLNSRLSDKLAEIFQDEASYLLIEEAGDVLYQTNGSVEGIVPLLADATYQIERVETEADMVFARRIHGTNLVLASIVSNRVIQSYTDNLIRLGLIILAGSIALAVPLAILVSDDITRPITRLAEHMRTERLKPLAQTARSDSELGVLEQSYNDMIEHINTLIEEQYRQEIARQKAQLKALQAQINPHFLSNTFQLIGGMALMHDASDIYDATIQLSKLVRYSMNLNKEFATLDEELDHMNDYLAIQRLRFGEQFTYTIDVDPAIRSLRLPILTLQPILENAFQHGLKKQKGPWHIEIRAEVGEQIHLHITDNGKGMRDERIAELNALFDRSHSDEPATDADKVGIGLINIDTRIKLMAGRAYGVSITPNPDGGVRVTLTLPKGGC